MNLAASVTLVATGNVSFAGTVDGDKSLVVNTAGETSFGAEVGGSVPLVSLNVAKATDLSANVTTVLDQQYGNTTLSGDVTATSTSNNTITFGTVDGSFSLLASTGGETAFLGSVGSVTPLSSVETKDKVYFSGSVSTVGSQRFGGNARLFADAVFASAANGDIDFLGNISGFASARAITVNTGGNTTFGGTVSNVTDVTTDAGGTTTLSGNVTATNNQAYGDDVNLAASVTLTGFDDTFAGNIAGNGNDLTLNFSDRTTINGANVSGLGNLSVLGGGVAELNGSITTAGFQIYNKPVELLGDTSLSGNAGTFAAGVVGNTNSLALNFSSTTALDGSFSSLTNLSSEGDVMLNGTITTLGSQTYNGTVALVGDTSLAGTSSSLAGGVAGNTKSLSLNFSQATAIDGTFSNLTNLSSEGNVTLNGTIATIGSQTYNGTASLDGDTSLAGTSLGLASGVAGNSKSLALNFTSTTALDGSFLNLTNLSSEGDVTLNGTITTSGSQAYSGSAALTGDTSLSGTAATFATGVAGAGNDLGLDFSGTTLVNGEMIALGNLTTEGGGLTQFNGSVSTAGFQNLSDNVQLLANATLSATAGNVSFGGTLDGTKVLNIEAGGGGQVVFTGPVGNGLPLASLNIATASAVDAYSTLEINGSTVSLDGLRIGAGVNNVNIAQPGSVIANADEAAVFLVAGTTNSTIAGFTISGGSESGVRALQGEYAGTTVSNLTMAGVGYGVYLDNARSLTVGGVTSVAGVSVTGSSYGIYATGNLSGSSFVGGQVTNSNYGALLTSATGLNVSSGSFADSSRYGVIVFGTSDGTVIQNNTITESATVAPYGVYLTGATGLVFGGDNASLGNKITSSRKALYATGDLDGAVIRANSISGIGGSAYGIFLDSASNLTIGGSGPDMGNEVAESRWGLYAKGDQGGTQVQGNSFTNGMYGALLSSATNIAVTANNTFTNYSGYGLLVSGSADGVVAQNNTIVGSGGGYGIYLTAGATGMTIGGATAAEGNRVSGVATGVYAGGELAGTSIHGTTITLNGTGSTGIQLTNASNLSVGGLAVGETNVITGAQYGIQGKGDLSGTIVQGSAVSGADYGLLLSSAQGVEVSGNNAFQGNSRYGILVAGNSAGSVIQNSTVDTVSGSVNGTQFSVYLANATGLEFGGTGANEGNRISGGDYGIYATGTLAGTSISGSTVDGANGTRFGIYLKGANDLTIGGIASGAKNVVSNSTFCMLGLGDLTGTSVSGNQFNEGTYGAFLSSATGLSLSGNNTFTDNSKYALFASGDSTGTQVSNNSFSGGAGSYGVYLSSASNLTIGGGGVFDGVNVTGFEYSLYGRGVLSGTVVEGNTFSGGRTGASLVAAKGLVLRENTYVENLYGVFASGASDGTAVYGNTFASNGSAFGVYLSNASDITVGVSGLTGTNLIENARTGIAVYGNVAGATLQNNNIRSANTGISLSGASGLAVDSNSISLASIAGLSASGVNLGVTISGNTFEQNNVAIRSLGSGLMIQANTITNSLGNGIVISNASGTNNTILSNSIFSNAGLGISLQNGGNDGQAAPTINSVSSTNVAGSMTGINGDVYRIQVFKTATLFVPSADWAQGETVVAEFNVTIGASGSELFSEAISGVSLGDWITLTATKLDGGVTPTNTSQFSQGVQVK